MLAPRQPANASSDELAGLGEFQLNVDGQRVTQNLTGGFGQPHYSRDAIAEFEFITNRFDATQGRSSGMLVNAITKSGTNVVGHVLRLLPRRPLQREDFVQDRVLPYSNQQVSGTFGGPIRRDRMHFFGNYEYEREPQTFSLLDPVSELQLRPDRHAHGAQGRRASRFPVHPADPPDACAGTSRSWTCRTIRATRADRRGIPRPPSRPTGTHRRQRHADPGAQPGVLNEVRAGYAAYYWIQDSIISWPDHPYPGITLGTPISICAATRSASPTTSRSGRVPAHLLVPRQLHDLVEQARPTRREGGRRVLLPDAPCTSASVPGDLRRDGRADPANIESLFPVWNDISSWNLNGLSPMSRLHARVGECWCRRRSAAGGRGSRTIGRSGTGSHPISACGATSNGRPCRRRRVRAMASGRPDGRYEQHCAATRRRVQPDREHGAPRRLRPLLSDLGVAHRLVHVS